MGWRVAATLRTDLSSMRLSKQSMTTLPRCPRASCITATTAPSTSRCVKSTGSRTRALAPSMGNRGDCYDNPLAESVIGLFKPEVIRQQGRRRYLEAVEFATLNWVNWFNTQRLLENRLRATRGVRAALL